MKLTLFCLVATCVVVSSLRAKLDQSIIDDLVKQVEDTYDGMKKNFDSCKYEIPNGADGIKAFYIKVFAEYNEGKDGSQIVFSCTKTEKNGQMFGDYLKVSWSDLDRPERFVVVG